MGERCQFVFTIAAESLSPVMFAVESCLSDQAYSIAACRSAADGFTELSDDLGDTVTKLEKENSGPSCFALIKGQSNSHWSIIHPSPEEPYLCTQLHSSTRQETGQFFGIFS